MMRCNTLLERFESKYIPEPNSGCWLWFGGTTMRGYGTIKLSNSRRMVGAHVASYMLFRGDVPDKIDVCHTCDTPGCVNPEHLFLGTRVQNMQDAYRKGRGVQGETCGHSKITDEQVKAIRLDARSQSAIASAYGLTQPTVSVIKSGKTWKHVK